MREETSFFYGFAAGAAVMFLLDPRQGGARRAFIRDKSVHVKHELEHAADIGVRDLSHRAVGLVARTRSGRRPIDVSPDVLVERVRSTLGHHCSHPHAIDVKVIGEGAVELKGPILRSDVDDVLEAVSRVRGVRVIDNDLEIHETPDIDALKGASHARPRAHRTTPATKLVLGLVAASTAVASVAKGDPLGLLLGGGGMFALARSVNTRSRTLVPHASA
jgi:hypothetical protein